MYCSVHSGFIIVLAECKTTLRSERFCSVFKEQIRAILRGADCGYASYFRVAG